MIGFMAQSCNPDARLAKGAQLTGAFSAATIHLTSNRPSSAIMPAALHVLSDACPNGKTWPAQRRRRPPQDSLPAILPVLQGAACPYLRNPPSLPDPRCFRWDSPGCVFWSDSAPQEGEHQHPHTLNDNGHGKLLGRDCNIVVHQRLNGNSRYRGTWYATYVVSCGRVAAILCAIQIMFNRVLAAEPGVDGPVCCTG